jgi:hypothetical protein
MAFLPNIAVAENIAVCAADEKPRAGGTAFLAPLAAIGFTHLEKRLNPTG